MCALAKHSPYIHTSGDAQELQAHITQAAQSG
jgi:hypothetical protein